MTKAGRYWTLAIVMAMLAAVEAVSGFVLWLGFPAGGSGAGRGWAGGGGAGSLTFWGLTKHTWVDIHDWIAVAFIALVVLHVLLHWKWIIRVGKSVFKGASGKPVPVPVKAD
jgi:hypothetical protein